MKDYLICAKPDIEVFEKICTEVEEHIPELKRGELLVDVDGSTLQIYESQEHKLVVKNSYYFGDVHIETDMDIDALLPFTEVG